MKTLEQTPSMQAFLGVGTLAVGAGQAQNVGRDMGDLTQFPSEKVMIGRTLTEKYLFQRGEKRELERSDFDVVAYRFFGGNKFFDRDRRRGEGNTMTSLAHLLAVDAARRPPLPPPLLNLAAELEGRRHQQQVLHHVQNVEELFTEGSQSRGISRWKHIGVGRDDQARRLAPCEMGNYASVALILYSARTLGVLGWSSRSTWPSSKVGKIVHLMKTGFDGLEERENANRHQGSRTLLYALQQPLTPPQGTAGLPRSTHAESKEKKNPNLVRV